MPKLLDRISPTGSRVKYVALRLSASDLFVAVDAADNLSATDSTLRRESLFELTRLSEDAFALKSVATGKYLTAPENGIGALVSVVDKVWLGEQFEVEDLGGYDLAIRAVVNRRYVSASAGATTKLTANADSVSSSERFRLMPVIDMAQVMTAFADRHTFDAKVETRHLIQPNTPFSLDWIQYALVLERRPDDTSASHNKIVRLWVGNSNRPGATFDSWLLGPSQVGIGGTYIAERNRYSRNKEDTDYKDNVYNELDPILVMSDYYLTPDMVGRHFLSWPESHGWHGGPGSKFKGETVLSDMPVIDTGGTIGARWTLKFSPVPGEGGAADEHHYFDLGPAVGVYDPEFGQVAYEHTNVAHDPSKSTLACYGDVQRYSPEVGAFWGGNACRCGLGSGQGISAGQGVLSWNRSFMLQLQTDGNLVFGVAVDPGGPIVNNRLEGWRIDPVIWQSGTSGHSGSVVNMQQDGNLVLGSVEAGVTFTTRTSASGAFLVVGDDGRLALYSPSLTVLWLRP